MRTIRDIFWGYAGITAEGFGLSLYADRCRTCQNRQRLAAKRRRSSSERPGAGRIASRRGLLPARGLSPEETAELAREQGGITIVPHPYHPFRHAIGRIPDCDAVEVYNSKHLFGIANARARLGAKKRRLPMVAGSDSHFAANGGLGVTRIDAEDDRDAVEAIRSGRTRIEGRRTPPRYFIGNTFKEIYKGARKTVRRI